MKQIKQITSNPRQKQNVLLPDGSSFALNLYYSDQQQSWFMSLTYGTLTINNFRIFNSPDMLYQYKNQLPFGLACVSAGDREPALQQDFSSRNSVLYVLTKAEVLQFEAFLSG